MGNCFLLPSEPEGEEDPSRHLRGNHNNHSSRDQEPPESDYRSPPDEDHRPQVNTEDQAEILPSTRTKTSPSQTPETMGIGPELKFASKLKEEKPAVGIDPRLTSLLEFFGELHVRRKDLFRRLISVHHEEFVELLRKMEEVKEKEKEGRRKPMMKRSQSVGPAAAARGVKLDNISDLRLQRFKIKTLDVDDDAPTQPLDAVQGGGTGGGKPGAAS
ncbi:hypothetical protein Dimus_011568 [Dionaea muscipula]